MPPPTMCVANREVEHKRIKANNKLCLSVVMWKDLRVFILIDVTLPNTELDRKRGELQRMRAECNKTGLRLNEINPHL